MALFSLWSWIAGSGKEWECHGLPADTLINLNRLSRFKRYKITEILFLDLNRCAMAVSGTEDSFFDTVSLRPGGVYTKSQLHKELEALVSHNIFAMVDLDCKTKPDGTLSLTVSFTEKTWQAADRFRCVNVGPTLRWKPVEMDPDMIEVYSPCLVPVAVQEEVVQMLREQEKVSARLLHRIRDRIEKWYHDKGYMCAQVVKFGEITRLVVRLKGDVCDEDTKLAQVHREIPEQLQEGHVFNIEAGKEALVNIHSLALFADILPNVVPDEKIEGGVIVEFNLW